MSQLNFSCFRNISESSVDEFYWTLNFDSEVRTDSFATAVLVSLIFLIGVPWNLFVIVTIVKKKLYSHPTIMLLLNLTITNLLLCLLVMPFIIITGFSGEYLFGDTDAVRCRVCQTGFLMFFLSWVSIYTLSLMSVDRFVYLKKPLKYSTLITPRRMLIALIITWVLCSFVCLPPLVGLGEVRFSPAISTCIPGASDTYYALLAAIITFPIIILFVMYVWILCIVRNGILYHQKKKMVDMSGDAKTDNSGAHDWRNIQLRLVRVFVVIFAANILWIPIISVSIATSVIHVPTTLSALAYVLYLSDSVIHPILQTCLIREVRITVSSHLGYCRRKLHGADMHQT